MTPRNGPPVPLVPTFTLDSSGHKPTAMSQDGTILWSGGGALYESRDGGATQTAVATFSRPVVAVRELGDGEVLVSLIRGDYPGELWRSTGYRDDPLTAEWDQVLVASSKHAGFSPEWQIDVHDNVVVACEYGDKIPPDNARKVYLSRDYGQTFTEILDAGQHEGLHVHGVAYDEWWQRLWVTHGDRTGTKDGQPWSHNAVRYSDDWGETWHWERGEFGDVQSGLVGIFPMRDCILFSTDGGPDGVHRIPRLGYRETGELEYAHLLDNGTEVGTIKMLGGRGYHRSNGDPVLIPFSAVSSAVTARGIVVASWNGYDWWTLWEDSEEWAGGGVLSIVGPTAQGTYVGVVRDGRSAGQRSRLTIQAPYWPQTTPDRM